MTKLVNSINELGIKAAVKVEMLKAKLHSDKGELASHEGGKVALIVVAVIALIGLISIFLVKDGTLYTDVDKGIHKMFTTD